MKGIRLYSTLLISSTLLLAACNGNVIEANDGNQENQVNEVQDVQEDTSVEKKEVKKERELLTITEQPIKLSLPLEDMKKLKYENPYIDVSDFIYDQLNKKYKTPYIGKILEKIPFNLNFNILPIQGEGGPASERIGEATIFLKDEEYNSRLSLTEDEIEKIESYYATYLLDPNGDRLHTIVSYMLSKDTNDFQSYKEDFDDGENYTFGFKSSDNEVVYGKYITVSNGNEDVYSGYEFASKLTDNWYIVTQLDFSENVRLPYNHGYVSSVSPAVQLEMDKSEIDRLIMQHIENM